MNDIEITLKPEAGQWYAEVRIENDTRVFVVQHQKTPLLACKRAIEIAQRAQQPTPAANAIPLFVETKGHPA